MSDMTRRRKIKPRGRSRFVARSVGLCRMRTCGSDPSLTRHQMLPVLLPLWECFPWITQILMPADVAGLLCGPTVASHFQSDGTGKMCGFRGIL